MTTFLLIRHASNDSMGRFIAGRMSGISLNLTGKREAEHLAQRLEGRKINRIISSPLERAVETAQPLAARAGKSIDTCEGLNEVDYGDWTGHTFEELALSPEWERWNTFRTGARPPGGESIVEVQARVIATLQHLAGKYPEECLALFSHGDVIKSALVLLLGSPLDLMLRLEVSPASISTVTFDNGGPHILGVNHGSN